MSFRIQIEAKVNPTEDIEKVRDAVQRLFSSLDMRIVEDSENVKILLFEAGDMSSLSKFKSILKQDKIRSAVRKALNQSVRDGKMKFYLNKQVAYVGHVSICEPFAESPLGPIEVKIETDEPYKFIEWLTHME